MTITKSRSVLLGLALAGLAMAGIVPSATAASVRPSTELQAAAATPSIAVASAESSANYSSGRGTVRITELGLQLQDGSGRVLWAFDASRCIDVAGHLLVGSPIEKSPTVCAAEQLARAIDKDGKASRSKH